jgi:ribokinase
MTEVVVVGSYNQDHVWRTPRFPVPGETRLGEFTSGPGGKGFNQAVAAARQGVRTAFVARARSGCDRSVRAGVGRSVKASRRTANVSRGCRQRQRRDPARCESGQNLIVVGPGRTR